MNAKLRLVVLSVVILFLSIMIINGVSAQPPVPPEVLENGEITPNLTQLDFDVSERNPVTEGDNSLNAMVTWWSTSGTTFTPSSNTTVYTYGGDGCVNTSNTYDVWRGSVNIPHGAIITGMYFNYLNNTVNPLDSTIWLRRYRYSGAYDDVLKVTGTYTGTGHHTHFTGTVANNTVNNYDYVYVLVWSGGGDQDLCGVNLRYTTPSIFPQALPMIKK